LLGGFGYAAVADWREREVTDHLWQVLGVLGVGLGIVALSPGGAVPVVVWTIVGGLTLQHLFPWDDVLGTKYERFADPIEAGAYLVVIGFVAAVAWRVGIGPTQVPIEALALLLTVLFARGLFEVGVLYGGADAKALMIAGVLVPLFPNPALPQSASVAPLLAIFPFSFNLLVDAALLSIVIPIGIGVRNAVHGEFQFPRGFSGYMIPVRELPNRFVWLKDPLSPEGRDESPPETSEDDRRLRVRAAQELEAKGVGRVWVTPQIPFLVLMAAGAVSALLAGNLILDIIARI
jgi:archaeal preflagellin peptidase FlaK